MPEHSKLLLYTDGFTEVIPFRGGEGDFENSGMRETLLACRMLPCGDFVPHIFNSLVSFRGHGQFDDDICLICLDA